MAKQIQREMREGPSASLPIPTRAQIEAAGIRVLLAIPLERTLNFAAFNTFAKILQKGWSFTDMQYGRTDAARNLAARTLLENPGFTHLMMLDDDHLHMPDIVERHVRWVMDDPEKLVIGGLHFRRGAPFEPCVFVRTEDGSLAAPAEWEAGIAPADVLGHGSLLVSRKVFEQLTPPFWRYTYVDGTYDFQSEDMYFSAICGDAGIQLWCDTTATSQHLINGVVDEAVFRAYLADHPEITNVRRDQVGQPDSVHLPDIATRIEA